MYSKDQKLCLALFNWHKIKQFLLFITVLEQELMAPGWAQMASWGIGGWGGPHVCLERTLRLSIQL